MDYLAIFVVGSKRFGRPRRFDRKTASLVNTGGPCKITASVFAFWYANSSNITGLKAFDPLDSTRLSIRLIFCLSSETILIGFTNLPLASPYSLNL